MKNLQHKIEQAPSLPRGKVLNALKVISTRMAEVSRKLVKQQAKCDAAAEKAHFTE